MLSKPKEPKKITAYMLTNGEEKSWIGVTDEPYIGSLAGDDPEKVKNALILALVALDYDVTWIDDVSKYVR